MDPSQSFSAGRLIRAPDVWSRGFWPFCTTGYPENPVPIDSYPAAAAAAADHRLSLRPVATLRFCTVYIGVCTRQPSDASCSPAKTAPIEYYDKILLLLFQALSRVFNSRRYSLANGKVNGQRPVENQWRRGRSGGKTFLHWLEILL